MRTALKYTVNIGLSDGVLFATALVIGATVGLSLEPWRAIEFPATPDVKLLGWLVVVVLCLSIGAMAWLTSGRRLSGANFGGTHMLEPQAPINQAFEPSSRPIDRPEGGPESRVQAVNIESADFESRTSDKSQSEPLAACGISPAEIKDPFLAALDYLGHAQATVRIGGILALERAAKQEDVMTACAGTLCAYIQQWAGPDTITPGKRPGYDVTAAMAVLSRLLAPGVADRDLVDLRRTQLAGLELSGADFSRYHLENSNLSGADLRGVNFSGVNLRGADLRGAQLAGAVFANASLRSADLTGAILSDDEFGSADLSMAGNITATQLLHIRFHPGRPPRLPAGLHPPLQNAAVAV